MAFPWRISNETVTVTGNRIVSVLGAALLAIGMGVQEVQADIDLGNLGNDGVTLDHGNSDTTVAGIGDFNDDGFDDLLVGVEDQNAAYVVWGKQNLPETISLNSLSASQGFKLFSNDGGGSSSKISVGYVGDVNGDELPDLIIGAPDAANEKGRVYVVFGVNQSSVSSINLDNLNGVDGFIIEGGAGKDGLGFSVSTAGDVNKDGVDDILVGTENADSAYVIFGGGSFGSPIKVGDLDGSNGFEIIGDSGGEAGYSVAGGYDINGDGIDDLVIGEPGGGVGGRVYVVYGRTAFSSSVILSGISGSTGVMLDGTTNAGITANGDFGISVASVGDVNKDNVNDLLIGAEVFVAPDSNSYFASMKERAIKELILESNAYLGESVAGVGDVDGDGVNDILVGGDVSSDGTSPFSDPVGTGYVSFGKTGFNPDNPDKELLDGFSDSRLMSVAAAGDVDGDGRNDLIVGDDGGFAYLVFGAALRPDSGGDSSKKSPLSGPLGLVALGLGLGLLPWVSRKWQGRKKA